MDAKGQVKPRGFLVDRKELWIGQIPLPDHTHRENTRSTQVVCAAHFLHRGLGIAKREQSYPPHPAFGLGAGLTDVRVVGVKESAFEFDILRYGGEKHGWEDYLADDVEPIQVGGLGFDILQGLRPKGHVELFRPFRPRKRRGSTSTAANVGNDFSLDEPTAIEITPDCVRR